MEIVLRGGLSCWMPVLLALQWGFITGLGAQHERTRSVQAGALLSFIESQNRALVSAFHRRTNMTRGLSSEGYQDDRSARCWLPKRLSSYAITLPLRDHLRTPFLIMAMTLLQTPFLRCYFLTPPLRHLRTNRLMLILPHASIPIPLMLLRLIAIHHTS